MQETGMYQFSLSRPEFEKLRALILKESGINLSGQKHELLRARLSKRLRATRCHTFEDYYNLVISQGHGGGELVHLIDCISTNKTEFFRESAHFTFLEEVVFPALRERKRLNGIARVRLWSAGCSTGEEPYSIAICMRRAFPPGEGWDARLLATDISTKVLAPAESGIYSASQLSSLTPRMLSTCFHPSRYPGEPRWEVNEDIKRYITFGRLNLMATAFPFRGPFDVIFCRNVMIYFSSEGKTALVSRFHLVLGEKGYLFIGHSESLATTKHQFRYVLPTIYQRV